MLRKNWSGSVRFKPKKIHKPDSESALASAIASHTHVRLIGAGHSFTPLAETSQGLISLDKFQGLISQDKDSGVIKVKAGTRLRKLGELLHEAGRGMANLGDIDKQSIAGALSTGTHGTGVELGTLSTQIHSMRLIGADGQAREWNEEKDPDLINAGRVSLGALGAISALGLHTVPAYKLKYQSSKTSTADFLARFESLKQEHRHFEAYWFPHTDVVQLKCADITDDPAKSGGIMRTLNDVVLENYLLGFLSRISRHVPFTTRRVAKICGWGVSSSSRTDWSYRVFSTPRLVRFHEMEYAVPADRFRAVFEEITEVINSEKIRVHFPIECRFVKGDDIWLSPAYGRDVAYFAIHQYRGMAHRRYFQRIENILKANEGRPHWGKRHTLTSGELRDRYPRWDDFQRLRRELDPKRKFLNPYLKRLFGER